MAGTGVGKFSSTAGSNTDNLTVNFAENMAPSNVNNAARELMGHMRDMYEQLGDGYFEFGDGDGAYTVTRGDADTITITGTGDITAVYYVGRKIRITDGGANVVEGVISASSHSSTTQTIDLTGITLASGTPTKVELGIDTAAFGGKVILDDDGDTYIEAPTDDTIDIYVAGAKDFVITANTFTAESGSTITSPSIKTPLIEFTDGDDAITIADGGGVTFPIASTFTLGFTSNAASTITTADNTDTLTLTSTDADANAGPNLRLYRNTSSPADDDVTGQIDFEGRNDNSQDVVYSQLITRTSDVSDGSEDGAFVINVMDDGTLRERMGMDIVATVFNDAGQDIDFRVESDANTHMFSIDAGDDRLFIGSNAGTNIGQGQRIQVMGNSQASSGMSLMCGSADAIGPSFEFLKSRNTAIGSRTIVADDDIVGRVVGRADDGTDMNSALAEIRFSIDGTPGENDTPGRISFYTTPDGSASLSERLRIHNNGVASFNNGVAIGVGTANTASNVLDDYEEGTFTVSLTGGAGGTSYTMVSGHETGHYTKIGNRVYINMYIRSSSINSAGGSTVINGLPFTSSSASLSYGSVVATYANNLNLGAAGYNVTGYVAVGSTIGHLVTYDTAAGVTGLTSAEWSDTGEAMLQITYAT